MELLKTTLAADRAVEKGDYVNKTMITSSGEKYVFIVAYYYNRIGFVHFAKVIRDTDYKTIGNAKAQYYNRTWEKYTGQSVFKQAIKRALKMKNLTQSQYEELYSLLEN